MTVRMKTAPHILIVDDDAEITSLLRDYLKRFGFETSTACDGHTMRRQLVNEAVDLVILDVMLPGRSASIASNILPNCLAR